MFEYQQKKYKEIVFDASDLIQYDVESNLPLFLNKRKEDIKNIVVVGAWQGDEVRAYLKFPSASIYCFEANPKTFKILDDLYKKEDRVHCYNYACSDVDGKAIFHETNIDGNGSLLEVGNHPAAQAAGSFEVDTIRLDSLPDLKGKHIDLLQVDVQGAELSVLRGAEQILKNTTALLIEVNARGGSYKGAATSTEIDYFIRQYGFNKIAQGLDQTNIEGNALYSKEERTIFDLATVEERIEAILALKIKKREVYHNPVFKFIHRILPQTLRTKLKKLIHFN
jgi:FkbM family methyltransferase